MRDITSQRFLPSNLVDIFCKSHCSALAPCYDCVDDERFQRERVFFMDPLAGNPWLIDTIFGEIDCGCSGLVASTLACFAEVPGSIPGSSACMSCALLIAKATA